MSKFKSFASEADMNSSTKFKWLLLLTATAIVMITPDFAIWSIHTLIEFLHALFEILEGTLDEIVEHLFHTDRHTTQIIVFYLMWAMFLYFAGQFFRYVKRRITDFRAMLPCWCKDKKEQVTTNWHQQSFMNKCKFISGCLLGALGLSYLAF